MRNHNYVNDINDINISNVKFICSISFTTNVRQLRKHTKPIIGGIGLIILIALAVLIMLAPTGAVMTNEQPATAAASPTSYIPNPTMNTNVTWSTFYNGWSPLEYNNGTGNQTLNAGLSSIYANPISVNPIDTQSAYLTNSNSTGTPFNSSHLATASSASGGSVQTESYANGIYTLTQNTSASSTEYNGWNLPGTLSDTILPSNNLEYDYITVAYSLSGPAMTGVSSSLVMWNSTGTSANAANTTIYPGQSIWESAPLSDFKGANFNTSISGSFKPDLFLNLPEHASTTYTIKLSAFMITDTSLYLGNNAQGTAYISINPELTTLNPDFTWQDITNNGYSVAVSQTLQNTTESQSAISGGNYIEQATYQGTFSLPTAPDLTYSTTSISVNLTTPGSQYEVATLNGISYLTTLQTKDNGTFVFASVNPNQQNSLILEIEFTAAQWNASTNAPSFFSIQGIEYYWWVGVIGLLSIVGLGAAASSHLSGEEENLKVPKGKFGR